MNILVVSQYFYPENFRINDLCLELVKRGHEITVYTGMPNYPAGELYTGYSFFKPQRESWKGISIIRSPLFPRKTGKLRLILNYFSFAAFSSIKAWFIKWGDFDAIYVFETSPITVAFPAIVVKKKLRIPLIMNVQDLWPDNVIAITGWNSPWVLKPLNRLVHYIYSKCDLLLTASKSFIPKILAYEGIRKEQVQFWPQFSTIEKTQESGDLFPQDTFNIIFTGNLGEAQNLELMIEAASLCRRADILWHIVGDGRNRSKLEELVKELHLDGQVIFHGKKEERQIPRYLNSADAALLILKPSPVFDCTIPAKLQTYLACGSAVLGCIKGEAKTLIEEEHFGITCEELTARCLADQAILMSSWSKETLNSYAERALICSKKLFDKNELIEALEKYFCEVKKDYV